MAMDTNILTILILTVLVYVFEHKILPTLITGFLSLYIGFQLITSSITQANVYIVFAYTLVFFYACYMMAILSFVTPQEDDNQ
jgi:xanthine/uracil permease